MRRFSDEEARHLDGDVLGELLRPGKLGVELRDFGAVGIQLGHLLLHVLDGAFQGRLH